MGSGSLMDNTIEGYDANLRAGLAAMGNELVGGTNRSIYLFPTIIVAQTGMFVPQLVLVNQNRSAQCPPIESA